MAYDTSVLKEKPVLKTCPQIQNGFFIVGHEPTKVPFQCSGDMI
jgi:hypothetical protein